MTIHKIIQGNCLEKLKDIKDSSIHLCVSSPPYFRAREYNKEDNNIGNNKDYNDYLDKIDRVITELYRVTIDGGFVAWNTSPVLEEGFRYMVPLDTHNLFNKNGFICRDSIIWKKPSGAAGIRCGGWVVNKGKPLTYHPNLIYENIFVYNKGGKRNAGEYDNITKYYPEIPKDLLTDVWEFNPETNCDWHPAGYPEELVRRCILLYSFKNDIILDPFLGSGTTMKVARELGRNSIGIELSPEYIEKAKVKIGFYQKGLFSQDEFIEV